MIGYKLFTLRKNGTIGPLFINKRLWITPNVWYQAEEHRTKGYAFRPGWHILDQPCAPHLSPKGRVWAKVEFEDYERFTRPTAQGGLWYLAKRMRVVEILRDLPGQTRFAFDRDAWIDGNPALRGYR